MNAYKCDICGKLFEEKTNNLIVETGQKKPKKYVWITGEIDVCSDCLKALQRVIDEKKNQNVQ